MSKGKQEVKMEATIKEIKTTFGGPCIYKQAILSDDTMTGRIQDIGQGQEKLEQELLDSVKSGRDDVKSFVDGIVGRRK